MLISLYIRGPRGSGKTFLMEKLQRVVKEFNPTATVVASRASGEPMSEEVIMVTLQKTNTDLSDVYTLNLEKHHDKQR